jgi:hypothetical protein
MSTQKHIEPENSLEWQQRRAVVPALMESIVQLCDRTDELATASHPYTLRRILREIGVSMDTIRARVITQAFTPCPAEDFWPPMRALLNDFAPSLGDLACETLAWDPAFSLLWEPSVRELSTAEEV